MLSSAALLENNDVFVSTAQWRCHRHDADDVVGTMTLYLAQLSSRHDDVIGDIIGTVWMTVLCHANNDVSLSASVFNMNKLHLIIH